MDTTTSILLKGIGLTFSTIFAIGFYQQITKRQHQLQQFKKAEIKDLSYLNNNKMKQGQQIYIKAKLTQTTSNNQNTTNYKIPIHYNQYYLEQPSDIMILNILNYQQIWEPIFKRNIWAIEDTKQNKSIIYGVKRIIGDPYTISRKYQPRDIGILKSMWGGLCYYIQCVFDLFRKSKFRDPINQEIRVDRQPVIKGPVVGILHYTIGLLTDAYFILKIKFQNGFHDAQILAQSRSSLLTYYKGQLQDARVGTIVCLTISSIFIYYIYKDIRKYTIFQSLSYRLQKGTKKWLQIQNIDQQKSCIICYTNCRNLILFDCKHLVMCWNCWKVLNHDQCPICKKSISSAKVVMEA